MNYVGNKRLNLPKDQLATERYLPNNKYKMYEILKNYGNICFYFKFIELRAWE